MRKNIREIIDNIFTNIAYSAMGVMICLYVVIAVYLLVLIYGRLLGLL